MSIIKRILCPTDFSEISMEAFRYADRLAASLDAELLVVHAFDVAESKDFTGAAHPADPALEQPAQVDIAGPQEPADPSVVTQFQAVRRSSPDLKLQRILHAGSPGEVVCWLAQNRNCDLIVIGPHGRSGLTHLLFGSVTEHTLRHAPCPVVVFRERATHEPPLVEPLSLPPLAPRFM